MGHTPYKHCIPLTFGQNDVSRRRNHLTRKETVHSLWIFLRNEGPREPRIAMGTRRMHHAPCARTCGNTCFPKGFMTCHGDSFACRWAPHCSISWDPIASMPNSLFYHWVCRVSDNRKIPRPVLSWKGRYHHFLLVYKVLSTAARACFFLAFAVAGMF